MGPLEIAALLIRLVEAANKAAELYQTINEDGREASPAEVAAVWERLDEDYEASRAERIAAIKRHGG